GENPSRLAALNIEPHEEAGYTSAVVTINRIQPICCNRAGSIYVHIWNWSPVAVICAEAA
ncbi:hypothetical protein QN224_31210, partial [Sinorhizobium sp. 8-89]|uniref:hypothetical protein n=1 Tax=Sinorhizobium sp. 7-81 TaxID=3049087 RepID=UPI0024C28127